MVCGGASTFRVTRMHKKQLNIHTRLKLVKLSMAQLQTKHVQKRQTERYVATAMYNNRLHVVIGTSADHN